MDHAVWFPAFAGTTAEVCFADDYSTFAKRPVIERLNALHFVRTSDFVISRAQSINDATAGLSVRFFRNTISAEIRGPEDFNGRTFSEA